VNDGQDGSQGRPTGQPGAGQPVGSVGEEAAKLFGALSDWAREQGADYAGTAAGAGSAFAAAAHDVNEHLATGSQDCRYCPVCQVIHAVRQTSPEVRTHLAVAASSLVQAAAGLLATHTGDQRESAPVEKIDLDADSDSDWGDT
jgi:hypothetical protein